MTTPLAKVAEGDAGAAPDAIDIEGIELEDNVEASSFVAKDDLEDEWESGPWWKRNKQRVAFLVFGVTACLLMIMFAAYVYTSGEHASSGGDGRADRLVTSETLIDLHNDLAWELRTRFRDINLWQDQRDLHLDTDFARMRQGGVKGQFWSAWVPCHPLQQATETVLEQIDLIKRITEIYANETRLCRTAADAATAWEAGKIASFIGLEGGHVLNGSLALLRQFKEMGVTYMTLTHSCSVSWAESSVNEGLAEDERRSPYASRVGLGEFGQQVIAEMNRIGMVIDLSHVSANTMRDVLRISRAPVIFSHSNPRALCDVTRNVPDDVLDLVKLNKGVVNINFYCGFISNQGRDLVRDLEAKYNDSQRIDMRAEYRSRAAAANCTIERVVDHILYVIDKIGIEHVGLGSDYDGVDQLMPVGLEDVSSFVRLVELLLSKKLDENEVAKIIGGNIIRVLEAVEDVGFKLRDAAPLTVADIVSPNDEMRLELTEADCVDGLCDPVHTLPGRHGAVATDSKTCSDVGAELLRRGGRAIDAAVGSALCLGVLHPMSSGIGGGGFMTVFDAATNESHTFNFREVAPRAANETMFLNRTADARRGALAAGIPGELRGLALAHALYGELSWTEVVMPAVLLAEKGYFVDKMLAQALQNVDETLSDPRFATFWSLFAPDGKIAVEGDKIKNPALGATLRAVARYGADAFYEGDIASNLVADVREAGGIFAESDMHSYFAERMASQRTRFRGAEVLGARLPSGSAVLATMLNIYDLYPASNNASDPLATHRMIEAMKFAFADRGQLGDPGFADLKGVYPEMIEDAHAFACRSRINDSRTYEPSYYNVLGATPDDSGTSHLSVIDQFGSAVALTTTVNLLFGSMMISPRTGVLLNDQMDDFSVDPLKPNAFGLQPNRANFVAAGKHPLSSMSPTIVLHPTTKQAWICIGASGGPTIPTSVFQVLVGLIDRREAVEKALDVPRLHHQLMPNRVITEPGYPQSVVDALRARNHTVDTQTGILGDGQRMGVVQFVVRSTDGRLKARSDPRKGGLADAF
jgi:gamma-glutamyltranspeptidase/glutathione hydrolase/leukotriene-C4 hydrolase